VTVSAAVCVCVCVCVRVDVDECRTSANNCRYACKNIVGSFVCICPDGYEQIGPSDVCQGIPRALVSVCVAYCSLQFVHTLSSLFLVTVVTMDTTVAGHI